ncbi:CRISPR-associated protein Cas1 [Roseovarius sp. MBR-78]|jgi:CRISPR-associated protein Cas1|uniref:type I-C CRISPR-associated endonuclease Cas1c n=1 Tax=Roseovarius sp. MBR-78 TaxID=3156460 RepID=UPI00339671CD
MKKLLNTLYVTSEGAWLRKDGANVVVEIEGAERGRAPLHLLGAIVCFGQVGISPQLMHAASEAGISITFLGWSGRFLARVEGPQSGNVLLRRAQHARTANDPVNVARAIVAAKIANQRGVIRRAIRDYGDPDGALGGVERRLNRSARVALDSDDLEAVRGVEGDAANAYFSVFDKLLRARSMSFHGRTRRPPRDPVNAVLSFLYVLLTADCRAALETVGLDPQMGFLHRDKPGRMSLAIDLMEEFRAPLADRCCLTLINRGQLATGDFRHEETGGVFLRDEARKRVLTAWQERKRVVVTHPFLSEKMPLGLVPHTQAQLLAGHLRGDLDGYPACIWR